MSYALGFIINFFSIIIFGQYDPVNFPDGDMLMEDSSAYDAAFMIAEMIGTIPPMF